MPPFIATGEEPMSRAGFALVLLATAAFASAADDKDPVREKLTAAKAAYDEQMASVRKQVWEWFDAREETARKGGDKKLVDQIKADRTEYEDGGELPRGASAGVKDSQDKARKALEEAYALAVKEYIRARKDEQAAAVETELRNIVSHFHGTDLLPRVNLKTHALGGEWQAGKGSLSGAAGERHARLLLPYEPSEEYDLELHCKRTAGANCLGVGLVAGGRQVAAVLDAWPENGYASGLELIQSKEANDNTTAVKGQLLKADQTHVIVYAVRAGKIEVSVNGKLALGYKGKFAAFSLRAEWQVPNKKALFVTINPYTSFQIDRLVVIPVKGAGRVLK